MDLNYIFRRRSIRKFTQKSVSENKILWLLKAAMAGPSAHNYQPWHFIVIRERQILNKIADQHPYAKMLYQAPLAIAVCGDEQVSPRRWVQDCCAATENILLALPELGLGGVWIGYYPRLDEDDFLREMLSIPLNIEVLSIIAFGYPDEQKSPRTQFNSNRIHYDKW